MIEYQTILINATPHPVRLPTHLFKVRPWSLGGPRTEPVVPPTEIVGNVECYLLAPSGYRLPAQARVQHGTDALSASVSYVPTEAARHECSLLLRRLDDYQAATVIVICSEISARSLPDKWCRDDGANVRFRVRYPVLAEECLRSAPCDRWASCLACAPGAGVGGAP